MKTAVPVSVSAFTILIGFIIFFVVGIQLQEKRENDQMLKALTVCENNNYNNGSYNYDVHKGYYVISCFDTFHIEICEKNNFSTNGSRICYSKAINITKKDKEVVKP